MKTLSCPKFESDPPFPVSVVRRIDQLADQFEAACARGDRPQIETYLSGWCEPERSWLLRELLDLEITYRMERGNVPDKAEYVSRFPGHGDVVEFVFQQAGPSQNVQEKGWDAASTRPAERAPVQHDSIPARFGRYRVQARIGSGGFGHVYLGWDDMLGREVAIKVARPIEPAGPVRSESFLDEARVVASLDHPHIVPVHDVGQTEDGQFYVVSQRIEGPNLAEWLGANRPTARQSAELIACLAEALHFAHGKKLVHRDVKPQNILLDRQGKPYLVDFGLALKDADFGKVGPYAGTPAYMSPEQARGEGHLVDGRSDVFSLGVVFYEMLTGELPFTGSNWQEVVQRIATVEARPPRQLNDRIPKELERICLRALAKRAADRYTTARDMGEDLRMYLRRPELADRPSWSPTGMEPAGDAPMPAQDRLIPKGLRPFDAEDAGYYIQLLPGPRDREGLPESMRFWKTLIEQRLAHETFRVGLIYGPSGCGKTSFVKAGLLPRLSSHVVPIYVESSPDETPQRLLHAVRGSVGDAASEAGLPETLADIRRRGWGSGEQKILLVLDQFEQYLHGRAGDMLELLAAALRQCDGSRLQCLLLVRDDFWVPVSRFMKQLEVKLVEGVNCAMVDLLDKRHAKKVLMWFGQAYQALPANAADLTPDMHQFLEMAVDQLADNHKVICVRLALLADMMKDRAWLPSTLTKLGGVRGVGVCFLEQMFDSPTAPYEHRVHRAAVCRILNALLPEAGTDLRPSARSEAELLRVSGYADRPALFEDARRILDHRTRLLTPVDAASVRQHPAGQTDESAGRFYQLTHDYLVPSLREWLTRRQRATRRGRAELRLVERAAWWSARPEKRRLPGVWEYLWTVCWTDRHRWTEAQRSLMHQARRRVARRISATLATVMISGLIAVWIADRALDRQAQTAAQSILNAQLSRIPALVNDLGPYSRRVVKYLEDAFDRGDPAQQLRARLALLPVAPHHAYALLEAALNADVDELVELRQQLARYQTPRHIRWLWDRLADHEPHAAQHRFRAACLLAHYAPPGAAVDLSLWQPHLSWIAEQLIDSTRSNPAQSETWIRAFDGIGKHLVSPLERIYLDTQRPDVARYWAAYALARHYAIRQPAVLMNLLEEATPEIHSLVLHAWQQSGHPVSRFEQRLKSIVEPADTDDAARREARLAIALLKSGRTDIVWPLWNCQRHRRLSSYLVHLAAPLQVKPQLLANRLQQETDPQIQKSLILALGKYPPSALSSIGQKVEAHLLSVYERHPDAGVHSAAEWLLSRWGCDHQVRAAQQRLTTTQVATGRHWYVTHEGHTMAVFEPVEFWMGRRDDERPEMKHEDRHRRRIPRRFAVSTKETTIDQFQRFAKDPSVDWSYYNKNKLVPDPQNKHAPDPQCPQIQIIWYLAAAYCNWLSRQEGIPESEWCYQRNSAGQYDEGMQAVKDFTQKRGYRLPTDGEWEYVCRAGSDASRHYGDSETLLVEYAWFDRNSADQDSEQRSWPVGQLMPNPFGMFDMLGNVWEWCHDRYARTKLTKQDIVIDQIDEAETIDNKTERVNRGGTFVNGARYLRAAVRNPDPPTKKNANFGFRIARTLPPDG